MRLVLDLRFAPADEPGREGDRVVAIGQLAELVRRPRELAALLWGTRWESVIVVEDGLEKSGVQAGALGLVGLARARGFELRTPEGDRALGRPAFLARAARLFATLMPAEAWRTRSMLRRLRGQTAADRALPRAAGDASSVTYLRVDPTLLWKGEYVGGAAAHTTGVINGFVSNGLDVHVYAAERPGGVEDVRFTQVPLRRLMHLVHWLTFVRYGDEVVEVAARERPDFVYQRYALGSMAGVDLAERLGVPLVLEFNGSEIWADKHWGADSLQLRDVLEALERRNLTAASLIVVVSDVLREQLVEQGIAADRVLVNPNGVDPDRLEHYRAAGPVEWRARLGRPDAPTIGFIGTFGLWHGVRELPAIAARVARERPDARWVVIGDGWLYEEVRAMVEAAGLAATIELTGVVPHERALELLASCEACVSPHVPNPDGSRFFGSPTKLFEYMGLGKAIVASDLEQIGEVLDHERTALLVRPGDPDAAAEAVVRLLDDPALAARLGAAALEDAQTTYSWEAHTRRILDALTA